MIKPTFALRVFPHAVLVLLAGFLASCGGSGGTGEGNTLASLRITDASFQRPTGAVEVFECIGNQVLLVGRFDDGSEENLTTRTGTTWTSSDPSVVQVSNGTLTLSNGDVLSKGALVPTGSPGETATITATFVGLSASQDVVVRPGGIEVSPTRPTIAKDTALAMLATAILGGGTTETPGTNEAVAFNGGVTWKSSDTSVATVDANGVVRPATPFKAGEATITADAGIVCLNTADAQTVVTVTAATLQSIQLQPTALFDLADMGRNTSALLRLIGNYAGGFTQDLTGLATLESSAQTTVAVFSPSLVQATNPTTNSAATLSTTGPDDAAVPTVPAGPNNARINATKRLAANGLSIEPASPTLFVGSAMDLDAIGTYTDPANGNAQSLQNLYRSGLSWATSDRDIVQTNTLGRIVANPEDAGIANITATRIDPVTTATLTDEIAVRVVERTAASVQNFAVTCPATVPTGTVADCAAVVTFAAAAGGGTQDVTLLSIWSSNNPAGAAEVSNAHPDFLRENEIGTRFPIAGRVYGTGSGQAVITASLFDEDGALLATGSDTIDNSGPPPPPDADNDGVTDAQDQCAATPVGEQVNAVGCPDTDDDDDFDNEDNCPAVANGDQLNTDGANDGGDACDTDDDNDGDLDGADNCPLNANADQLNTDGANDGGDACDTNDDNDSVPDATDQCPLVPAGPNPSNTRLGCPCNQPNPLPVPPACLE